MNKCLWNIWSRLRDEAPLIHAMTNYVTANDCANVLLAAGASPVMADSPNEAAEVTQVSSALILNMGTLNEQKQLAMLLSGKQANESGIPVVLDPVGVGATRYRKQAVQTLLKEVQMTVIRGNAAEIEELATGNSKAKGVDAQEHNLHAPHTTGSQNKARNHFLNPSDENKSCQPQGLHHATMVARQHQTVVVMTGAVDIITDGEQTWQVGNGHQMMRKITGAGCMLSVLMGAMCAVEQDSLVAALSAAVMWGIAAEQAGERAAGMGTGSFRVALIDGVSELGKFSLLRANYEKVTPFSQEGTQE